MSAEEHSDFPEAKFMKMLWAHGIIMGVVFAVILPLGAVVLRVTKSRNTIWIHAGWQIFALVLAIAGLGLGVWLAILSEKLVTFNGHAIIGIVVVGM